MKCNIDDTGGNNGNRNSSGSDSDATGIIVGVVVSLVCIGLIIVGVYGGRRFLEIKKSRSVDVNDPVWSQSPFVRTQVRPSQVGLFKQQQKERGAVLENTSSPRVVNTGKRESATKVVYSGKNVARQPATTDSSAAVR